MRGLPLERGLKTGSEIKQLQSQIDRADAADRTEPITDKEGYVRGAWPLSAEMFIERGLASRAQCK